ncbi:unnamed protein product [Cylindrotheca closterium]|uniref:Uncharacterized protein n=1 Tax=Cylindrotheca closterium TaxID=2856 RepID=A0AAD2FP71_9STRA|nr:unnamed protein product [Cylindrotheca closterium]
MMISLQDTLQLNNQAVALYQLDDLPLAAKALYESLRVLKQLMKGYYLDDDVIAAAMNTAPQHECLHTTAPKARCDASTQNEPFVYQSALILQESPASSTQDMTQAKMTIYCAGVAFNTAILHHQQAFKTGRSASLHRAAKLYECCLQLVGQFIHAGSNNTVSLITMAATNNLAQIELEKGLLGQACRRLQFLKALIQSLQHTATRMFTVDELQSMISNTLSAEGVIASPAA